MAHDKHEYVRRRALHSLLQIGSSAVEELALTAWQQPDEDQEWARIMALYCLHKLGSARLEPLLAEAERHARQYIREYADRIRRGVPPLTQGEPNPPMVGFDVRLILGLKGEAEQGARHVGKTQMISVDPAKLIGHYEQGRITIGELRLLLVQAAASYPPENFALLIPAEELQIIRELALSPPASPEGTPKIVSFCSWIGPHDYEAEQREEQRLWYDGIWRWHQFFQSGSDMTEHPL